MATTQSESTPTNGVDDTKQSHVNGHHEEAHYQLPSAQTLQEAGDLMIKDEHGKEVPFKSLYENQSGQQLIVFIRHFFCGHCEEFIRFLSQKLPPSTLSTTTPPTTLTVIGCGDPVCIPDYRIRTMSALGSDTYQIYTDREMNLYNKLGMLVNLKQSEAGKPEYISTSIGANVLDSMKNMVKSGGKAFKGGKYSQNGGEWVFKDGQLMWCRRMRNTQDHATVAELREVVGLTEA